MAVKRRARLVTQPGKEPDHPPTCPYCKDTARCVRSVEVYRRDYGGFVWVCGNWPQCDSYVGCHKGTKLPLGILANKELRELKMKVHAMLDPLWKSGGFTRDQAYELLAKSMLIPYRECHIGEFDELRCKAAIDCVKRIKAELVA